MSKKFKDLIPGNSLYILCIDPETDEATNIISGIVDNINESCTVLGVRCVDPDDKSKMKIGYFRINPESYINDSLKDNKEHRIMALFESKMSAVENYIYYCEGKIEAYKSNILKAGEL